MKFLYGYITSIVLFFDWNFKVWLKSEKYDIFQTIKRLTEYKIWWNSSDGVLRKFVLHTYRQTHWLAKRHF